MSFSTGFTRDDSVNAERAAEVGIEMEIKPRWTVSDINYMDVKSKVKALSSLRKISMVNKKIHLDSVKLFN